MARASYKRDLLDDARNGYEAMLKIIDSIDIKDQEKEFPFEDRDRNVRDVLVHLLEWQNMMNRWYQEGCVEEKTPAVPREGYTWFTIGDMNLEIWKEYQDVSLQDAKDRLQKSHDDLMKLMDSLSNEQLFARNVYAWTKDTVLGSYFVSATSSHYEWAVKKLRKFKKAIKGL